MDRFGFNAKPQLDLPDGQMSVSGVFDNGTLLTGAGPDRCRPPRDWPGEAARDADPDGRGGGDDRQRR